MKFLINSIMVRRYWQSSDVEQVITLSALFSISLVLFRIAYTGQTLFLFMVWNLFLAWVPFAISRWLSAHYQISKKWKTVMAAVGWLLFVPNAFYLITDLFHLDMNESVPLWFDLALLLSFAWSGLLFGIVSVRHMEKLIESRGRGWLASVFVPVVMVLNSFGVYIGRYLRFNSWDIITNPLRLFDDTMYLFLHPVRSRFEWSMIICYTVLLSLMYYTIKKLSKVL